MTDVPHFEVPLRIDPATGDFAVVEEGSTREIGQCIVALAATPLDHRMLQPGLGLDDPTHLMSPTGDSLTMPLLEEQLRQFEPRAEIDAEADGVDLASYVDQVWIGVDRG